MMEGGRGGNDEGEGGREGGGGRRRGGARAQLGFPTSLQPSLIARGPSLLPSLVRSLPPEARVSSLPPALPHCLLHFLKLYNVFNDNVQSIRLFSGITSPIRPPTLRNITSSNVER